MKYAVTRNPKNHREVNEFMGKLNKKTYSGTGCHRGGNGKTWTQDYLHYPHQSSKTQSNVMFGGYTLVSLEKLKEIMKSTKVSYRLIKTYPGSRPIGHITTDDMSAFTEYYEVVKPCLKVGDFIKWTFQSENIYQILEVRDNYIVLQWYFDAYQKTEYKTTLQELTVMAGVQLATPDEIAIVKNRFALQNAVVEISGRKSEFVKGGVNFGCNNFTLQDLQSYRKFLNYGAKTMTANGTSITVAILDKLIKYIENGTV